MADLLLALFSLAALGWVGVRLVALADAWLTTRRITRAFFALFLKAAGDDAGLSSVAIDADWVALWLLGHPTETPVWDLKLEDQARVRGLSVAARRVGTQLVKEGLFRLFDAKYGPDIEIAPPKTLFMLSPTGVAQALAMSARKGR